MAKLHKILSPFSMFVRIDFRADSGYKDNELLCADRRAENFQEMRNRYYGISVLVL